MADSTLSNLTSLTLPSQATDLLLVGRGTGRPDKVTLGDALNSSGLAATTTAYGVVQLAASGGTTAGTVVQATDARLSDTRNPPDGDKGDITVASGTSWSIDNDAVTYAKMQNVSAASKLLGRGSAAGSGDVEEITLGTGLSMSGTTLSATGGGAPDSAEYLVKTADATLTAERVVSDSTSVVANWATGGQVSFERAALTGDVTASANSNATTIANDAVTYAKMQNVSATDKVLGRASAGSGDVEEIACTAAGRALIDDADAAAQRTTLGLGTLATQSGTFSGTSSGNNTGDQTISLTGDVTGSGTGSFAATIANDAVTYAKMQNASAASVLLGRGSASGSGNLEEITIGTGLTMSGTTLSASGGGGGAPDSAEYLVKTADATLTAERVVGDSTSVVANWATSGQVSFERAALTGDVTASANSNSTTIANGVVSTAKLGGDITTAGKALLDDADAAAQRTTLGLGTLATQSGTFSGTSSGTNTGDQTISLTGDVTGSGTGSFAATIASGAVSTSKLGGDITTAGKALLDDADAAAQRTTLGLGTLATQSGTFSGTSSGTNTGDQTIALTGDVTGSGTGSFAATIANDAVSYAKIQNVSGTDKVLGRSSAGAGDIEEITCTAAGRALIDDADAAAQRTTLGLGTLATQSGTFSGTSSGTNTGDQTITLTGDVTGSGTGSFAATIANDSVSNAKLANMTASTIKARITGSTGDPEDATLTQVLDLVGSSAQGDILYRGASTWTRLAAGTSGNYLKTNGTGANPEWAAVSASGGGTKTYADFTPLNNQPPSTAFATLDTRNSVAVLDFDDGATNESSIFVSVLPEAAVVSSGLKVRIHWMATSATSGNCRWGAQFADLSDQDIDSYAFDTATEVSTATSGTSGNVTVTEITCTSIDSISAGKPYAIKVYRDSSDTTNDTMTGDAELIAVEVRSGA